ncbi:MAG: hypothetical protein ACNS61_05860 [Candidatus Wenzhouxiangella sp. M2_3B_020]
MFRDGGVDAIIPLLMPDMLTGRTRMEEPAHPNYLATEMRGPPTRPRSAAPRPVHASRFHALDEIEVSTLVLAGLADPVYAYEISRDMLEAIGDNAELSIVDGAAPRSPRRRARRRRVLGVPRGDEELSG